MRIESRTAALYLCLLRHLETNRAAPITTAVKNPVVTTLTKRLLSFHCPVVSNRRNPTLIVSKTKKVTIEIRRICFFITQK